MTSLCTLPNELLHNIANALPAQSRARLSGVSRRMHAIANDERSWERLYLRDAGPQAHAVATADTKVSWKARYGAIHATVQHPYLTPPALARPGDVVTVREVEQAGDADIPCRVLRRRPLGFLNVVPLPHEALAGKAAPFTVHRSRCINGAEPALVPVPTYCFANPETLRPNDVAEINDELPTRTIFTTGVRPGDKVTIRRAAVGLSGMTYFQVEEPPLRHSIQDLVAVYAAKERQRQATSAPRKRNPNLHAQTMWHFLSSIY